jgi:hypothetical protein
MARHYMFFGLTLIMLSFGIISCERNLTGSVTETGNITGQVVSTKSKPVAGAKIVVFRKICLYYRLKNSEVVWRKVAPEVMSFPDMRIR